MIRKILKQFKEDKEEEQECELQFLEAKSLLFGEFDGYKKEKKVRKGEKIIKEIDTIKTKREEIEKLIIKTIEHDSFKHLIDLDVEEKVIVKEMKDIEIKLKKVKVPERIFDTIKILLFTNVSCECYGLYELYLD